MRKDTFLHEVKGGSVTIGNWTLWHKPTRLVNDVTGERISFKNIDEAYEQAVIDGRPLKEIVAEMRITDLYDDVLLDDSDIQILSSEEAEEYLEWVE